MTPFWFEMHPNFTLEKQMEYEQVGHISNT